MNFARFFLRKIHDGCRVSKSVDSMEVQVVGRDIVRPSERTPTHLRWFKLSLMEQLAPTVWSPFIFFYSSDRDRRGTPVHRLEKLKRSLSKTLDQYYPLAGRMRDNKYIECNDWGADFVEAEVTSSLSDFLGRPYAEGLHDLIPVVVQSEEANTKLLQVQASFFDCGGMALGVCLSHKFADTASVSAFMRSWTALATARPDLRPRPVLDMTSVFPPKDISSMPPPILDTSLTDDATTERFVFDGPSVRALQAESSSLNVERPTRVEAVSALVWKSLLKAARTATGRLKPSIAIHSVNIRPHVDPRLDKNSIGNLVSFFAVRADEAAEIEHQKLVAKIREAKEGFHRGHAKRLRGNERAYEAICEYNCEPAGSLAKGRFDYYLISSTCGFGLYEMDFGWGRPTWVTIPCPKMPNVAILFDTEGDEGGIEAWITLKTEEMDLFRQDADLLHFASLNPRVCH